MICKPKGLGLALVVAVAMSVTTASTASASPFWFASDGDWTRLEGSQGPGPDELKFDGVVGGFPSRLICIFTLYKGSTSSTTSTTMTLAPEYLGCELEPFGLTTVDLNGCAYVFHTDNNTGGGFFDAETTIECPAGKDITVTASIGGVMKCTIHIEPQNLGTGAVFTNEEIFGAKDLRAHINFSNIKYTQTTGTGAGKCTTTSTTNNGIYNGSATIRGFNTSNEATSIGVGST